MKYRAITFGYRNIGGILIQQGSIIEKYDELLDKWIYLDCMHPDDAEKFVKNKNNEK